MEEQIKKNPIIVKWKIIAIAIFLVFAAIIGGLNYGVGSTPEEYILDETNFKSYTFTDEILTVDNIDSNHFIFLIKNSSEDNERNKIKYISNGFEIYLDCESKTSILVKIFSSDENIELIYDEENSSYTEPDYDNLKLELSGNISIDMTDNSSEEEPQNITLPFNKEINNETNFIIIIETSIITTADKIYFSFEKSVE